MRFRWLRNWTNEEAAQLDVGILAAEHNLAESGLFARDRLADLLDRHPPEHLTVSTMGAAGERFRWEECDRNGLTGAQLLAVLERGPFWINVLRLLDFHPEMASVMHAAYDELELSKPGFQATQRSANLILSSPQAQVYYHVDCPCNILWHIQGRKRVWVYPQGEPFVSQRRLELLHAGEHSEDFPYEVDFDAHAEVFDLEPGQVVTWAQNTPHRVENTSGINVSVSTEHLTSAARRRINVHLANKMLRERLGYRELSTGVDDWRAHLKVAAMRGLRLAGRWLPKRANPNEFHYPVVHVLDADSPTGLREPTEAIELATPADEVLV